MNGRSLSSCVRWTDWIEIIISPAQTAADAAGRPAKHVHFERWFFHKELEK